MSSAMQNEQSRSGMTSELSGFGIRKVSIIGCAGAGKSTLAVKLGSLLDLPVIHIDAAYWRSNWEKPSTEEWQRQHQELLVREAWIMDGNYGGTMKERIAASDTVILLALPRFTCLFRVLKRALRDRGRSRPDMNPGCLEELPDREFLGWIWNYNKTRLPRILQLLEQVKQEKIVVILRSNAHVDRFLNALNCTTDRAAS